MVNVTNLLTLRYDPDAGNSGAIRNILSQEILNSRQTTRYSPSSEEIETALRYEIRNKINTLGAKRVPLAISAGIDSNLILCLIRKEFPNIKLDCLTVGFDLARRANAGRFVRGQLEGMFADTVDPQRLLSPLGLVRAILQ